MAQATRQVIGAGALLMGFMVLALPLQAQPVYRCANSYSQTPCPGGMAINVEDGRSPAQKAQSDAAIAQAVRLANEMEKNRLKSEQIAGKPATRPVSSNKPAPAKETSAKQKRGQKDAQPGPFVAFTPPQEKPVAKKSEAATTKP